VPEAPVLYEAADAVATLTLNRPDRLNTIVPALIDAFDEALARANTDPDVRVVRLRGAGRTFCAGYDIDWGAQMMEARRPSPVARGTRSSTTRR
jgi:enoyl-CoA hydratase